MSSSLDSEQWLKSKGSKNSDENSGESEALNKVTFCGENLVRTYFLGTWIENPQGVNLKL